MNKTARLQARAIDRQCGYTVVVHKLEKAPMKKEDTIIT